MSESGKYPVVAVTTDIVVFSILESRLNVLLIERGREPYAGQWALPGGFIHPDEGLEDCARRELEEETGIAGIYLEQLYSFGAPERDPRGRVVTVAYFALVPRDRVSPRGGSDARRAEWFALDDMPRLAFDHDRIVAAAHQRLIAKLGYSTIAFQLLPQEFTLSEVQSVHEIIRGERLDKRNFRKSILALGVLHETGRKRAEGSHRPAMLYALAKPGTVVVIR
ncbi:MAG: NUDIX hydrolase [Hyphomicrobiales bacterium]